MRKPKLMVIGHARYGKDTVCNLLSDFYNFTFVSSSLFVAGKAVIPWLEAKGVTYPSFEAAYADRINRRSQWFDAISAYNAVDPARLGLELFAEFDIYCGLRNRREFEALKAKNAFDVCFWVDRSQHEDEEPTSSFDIPLFCADYIIDNNGTFDDLKTEIIIQMNRARDDGKIGELPKLNLSHL